MISRFCRYIDKVFGFGRMLDGLGDSRVKPQISTSAIFTSAFAMFVMRRGSLNAMESDLRLAKRLDGLIGERKPSADRIGDVFACMDPGPVREILSAINHRLGRNKVLKSPCPMRFVAVDGHELFSQ